MVEVELAEEARVGFCEGPGFPDEGEGCCGCVMWVCAEEVSHEEGCGAGFTHCTGGLLAGYFGLDVKRRRGATGEMLSQ